MVEENKWREMRRSKALTARVGARGAKEFLGTFIVRNIRGLVWNKRRKRLNKEQRDLLEEYVGKISPHNVPQYCTNLHKSDTTSSCSGERGREGGRGVRE